MTGESQAGDPGDTDDPRRQLLDTVGEAIENEDYEFMLDVVNQQNVLRPFEIVEYMDVKRRAAEDPVTERRWRVGIENYFDILADQEFPQNEIDVLDQVVQRLQFDAITQNEEVAEESTHAAENEDNKSWDSDEFHGRLDQETIGRIRKTPVFQLAEAYASGQKPPPYGHGNLEMACRHIKDHVRGELQTAMLQVLDHYVCQEAEAYASGQKPPPYGYGNLEMARKIASNYASSRDIEAEIKAVLDKYVYAEAEKYVLGQKPPPYGYSALEIAANVIKNYASTPERRDVMLSLLGFM